MELSPQSLQLFFNHNADLLRKLADRRDTTIGFNAFTLISDTYYRENFHSDIIRAILDPHEAHGEGTAFLRLFVQFLSLVADKHGEGELSRKIRRLKISQSTEVVREEGRIDVKIKAPDWTIIVENKINGANDMDRQIPRYIEKCKKAGEEVVAVVYITAAKPGYPSKIEPDDDKMVKPFLLPVVGFSEDRSFPNLAEGWVERCELVAKGFNTKSILNQYAELLRNHAGETMDQNDIKEMLKSMNETDIPYTKLYALLDKVPETLADIIYAKFAERKDLVENVHRYNYQKDGPGVILLLSPIVFHRRKIPLSIEIWCKPEYLEEYGIDIYANTPKRSKSIVNVLKGFDPSFAFSEEKSAVLLPLNPDDVYGNVDAFLEEIEKLLLYLNKNKTKLEECLKKAK